MTSINFGGNTLFPKLLMVALVCRGASAMEQMPPAIGVQPQSQTALAGTKVTFNVAVTGTGPFSYQWQFNGTNLPNGIISTVAGNGSAGYSGDGGNATNAGMRNPTGLTVDSSGNLFIADVENNRIRKVDTHGTISTAAGIGTNGYSGDGGSATNAELYFPFGVTADSSMNLFIVDNRNNRIRKVNTNGVITTVAGSGPTSQEGSYSGDGGAATNARLNSPYCVAADTFGNLFIADTFNNRIRKVDAKGVISTVAGNG